MYLILTNLWINWSLLQDKFSEPHLRPLRAAVFVLQAVSGLIPTIHYIIRLQPEEHLAFYWLVIEYILQIKAVLFFASHYPEKLLPGKFDIWFSSHQLFHIFTLLSTLAYVRFMFITVQNTLTVNYNKIEIVTEFWQKSLVKILLKV